MKRQAIDWEQVFAKHIFDNALLTIIYKELLEFNKTTNFFKWTRNLNRHHI